jgi:hypothetical protein
MNRIFFTEYRICRHKRRRAPPKKKGQFGIYSRPPLVEEEQPRVKGISPETYRGSEVLEVARTIWGREVGFVLRDSGIAFREIGDVLTKL